MEGFEVKVALLSFCSVLNLFAKSGRKTRLMRFVSTPYSKTNDTSQIINGNIKKTTRK